jgi:hypothetical protein
VTFAGLALATGASLSCGAPLAFYDTVDSSSRSIPLSALADLSAMPATVRPQAAALNLFTMPPRRKEQRLRHTALASRARSLMPLLAPCLLGDHLGETRIRFGPPPIAVMAVPGQASAIQTGDRVSARIRTGIVTIERKGVALQPAQAGDRLFLRTPDGALSALCCEVK